MNLFFLALAFVITAWGQPANSTSLSLVASFTGYALCFIALFSWNLPVRQRFVVGTLWYACVQAVQLSWALTHPFWYIYPLWIVVSLLIGAQFGLLAAFVSKERLKSIFFLFQAAGLWVLLEWSRLFWLSGVSWNPAGLALSAHVIPLQMASLWGVYGMSFWVILTNLSVVRSFYYNSGWLITTIFVMFPYLFGALHLSIHQPAMRDLAHNKPPIHALLVQPATRVEDTIALQDPQSVLLHTLAKWKQILLLLRDFHKSPIDLIVLPEYVVPLGTYYPVFPYESVKHEFERIFGKDVNMPAFAPHLAAMYQVGDHKIWMVNNAFFSQAIANIFNAEVIVGLEDSDETPFNETAHYSCAITFFPDSDQVARYEKRVLVPLGEYIPFEFCRDLAASYGIAGSFTPGSQAKVVQGRSCAYGLSICYEETYGNVMRDNRLMGAELLVNLTNDFWYPCSLLPQQHFDHARLRAVEMGIPLVRAANNGVTAAVDSLGRIIARLGNDCIEGEGITAALSVFVPPYTYRTLYTFLEDFSLLIISAALLLVRRWW